MELIIPKKLNFSTDPEWEVLLVQLPNGYRHVASVERPTSDGNVLGRGEMYDLGQNAEGNFLLFRRLTGPFESYSHAKGEKLSPTDLIGFGLLPHQSQDDVILAEESGEYSSLARSNLVGVN